MVTDVCSGFGLECVAPAFGVGRELAADFVSYSAENRELFLLGSGCMGRIVERPVMTIELPGKNGTCRVSVAANGDDCFYRLVHELVPRFRAMCRNIDPDFFHRSDGEWVNIAGGFGARAHYVQNIASDGSQNAFSEVTATGIAGAENENCWLHDCR